MSQDEKRQLSLSHWGMFEVQMPIILIPADLAHLLPFKPGGVIPIRRLDIAGLISSSSQAK